MRSARPDTVAAASASLCPSRHALSTARRWAIDSGSATFQTLGAQDRSLEASLQQLPPTLTQADRTLTDLRPFADAAAPAFSSLLPAAEKLPGTLSALKPLFVKGAPALSSLARVSVSSRPLVTALPPTLGDLVKATPSLTNAFSVPGRTRGKVWR